MLSSKLVCSTLAHISSPSSTLSNLQTKVISIVKRTSLLHPLFFMTFLEFRNFESGYQFQLEMIKCDVITKSVKTINTRNGVWVGILKTCYEFLTITFELGRYIRHGRDWYSPSLLHFAQLSGAYNFFSPSVQILYQFDEIFSFHDKYGWDYQSGTTLNKA
jgi:hypothetical protein